MKINEITEGWGQHSNKSNHTMNKFKREETDEAFADAWSTVKKGAQAVANTTVGGAIGRQAKDVANTALSKMGSGQAAGKQQIQRAVGGIIKNFSRYVGQTGGKPTVGALKQYLNALGIKDPVMEVRNQAALDRIKGGTRTTPKKPNAQAQQAQQAPGGGSRKDTDVLTRNQLFDIIGRNIQQAMKAGTLPKELKKFLGP
jgi:hypothetical protein